MQFATFYLVLLLPTQNTITFNVPNTLQFFPPRLQVKLITVRDRQLFSWKQIEHANNYDGASNAKAVAIGPARVVEKRVIVVQGHMGFRNVCHWSLQAL